MSGERDAIIAAADEWYEAVVSLFVWTREVVEVTQEEEDEEENLDGLEALLFEHRKRRELYRLREIVEGINDEHPMDQTSSIQIMLGGAMASDPSLCVELSDHSVLAAAALVEIGSATGWIPRETTAQASKAGSLLMDDFNADDMEVLGMDRGSPDPAASDAEDILRTYASALFGTEWIDEAAQIEGWEFGVGVLSRVKDGKLLTSKLLSDIPLTSAERVDKLLQHCTDTSLPTTASSIAYSWATKLQQTTPNAHGNILQYLALAPDHPSARADMHKLLTSLITTTLRSGTPPTADDTLAELLTTPSAVRSDLLRFELAGYAALRHYYEIRTADPAAATQALVAVIRSAGEGVDGGVWDRAWEAPVEPAVLPLLWRELLGCWQWMGVREALDVAKGVTDWEAADGEVKAESDKVWREAKEEWVDVKEEKVQDVLRRVRLGIAKVLADRWVMGEE
ncbi:hypothetical protein EDC01DRAFT_619355 [Geopyxis carbonaria]|nr:hypothetical protein EDC01DRAFT_619355 [Geopyxis carbonaria]